MQTLSLPQAAHFSTLKGRGSKYIYIWKRLGSAHKRDMQTHAYCSELEEWVKLSSQVNRTEEVDWRLSAWDSGGERNV